MTIVRVEPDGPLDLAASLDEGQAFGWTPDDTSGDGWWAGLLGACPVRMRTAAPVADGYGELEIETDGDSVAVAHAAVRYLRLDDDHAGLIRVLRDDAVLAPMVDAWPGLRLLRQDPWDCLVSFILSAHCHLPRIKRNLNALANAAESPVGVAGRTMAPLPSAWAVVELGEARLRDLGLGFRAPNLWHAALAVSRGEFELDALRAAPYEEARAMLMTLRGVGPKIADCVLAFSLDHTEAFAVDRWVRRAVTRRYLNGARMTEERVAEWGRARFGNHAAYAQQLLFHVERTEAMAERPLPGSRARRARQAVGGAASSG